jgi:PhnB protein
VQVAICTRDLDESVKFYTEVFDLRFNAEIVSFEFGEYDTDSFCLLTVENWLDDATPSAFGLLVDDVDVRHRSALEHGATEVSAPADFDWKPRCSIIDDPSGNRIQLAQA